MLHSSTQQKIEVLLIDLYKTLNTSRQQNILDRLIMMTPNFDIRELKKPVYKELVLQMAIEINEQTTTE